MLHLCENFYFSTRMSDLNIDYVFNYLINTWWGKNYNRDKFQESIKNSFVMSLFVRENETFVQVGFSRLITDYSAYGYLADVFIEKEFQRRGVGKLFMKALLEHESIAPIGRISLSTLDKHGFYEKIGFKKLKHPESQLELRR